MKITENISLAGLNSFGVEARATRLVEWDAAEELADVFAEVVTGGEWMALGGGNNILFTSNYAGVLIKSHAAEIAIVSEDEKTVRVRAQAGMDWGWFVKWCVAKNLWGAENLAGIPGTVGAAPIQNIGAYGAEAKDIIASVEYFDVAEGVLKTMAACNCEFGYRESVFKRALKGRAVVTAVDFELSKIPRPRLEYGALADEVRKMGWARLEHIALAVKQIRDSKLPDPRQIGNAGSFFKNPVVPAEVAKKLLARYPDMPVYPAETGGGNTGLAKLAAGWLIEQAGWKGRNEGRVGIHPRQALIVVNLGGATGAEILDFAARVVAAVKEKFGVELEMEVNVVGGKI